MSTHYRTFQEYIATANQTDFAFNFVYLEDEHVKVFVDDVEQALTTNFTIQLTPTKEVILSNPTTPLAGGEIVLIRRISAPDSDLVDFQNGSILTETALDRSYLHNRYLAEESAEQNEISLRIKVGGGGAFDALNNKMSNLSDPTADQDATTKAYVDGEIFSSLTGLNGPPEFSKLQGDGSNTDFSLTFNTNSITSAAVLVTINGEVQDPDDYTIVGADNEIRFTTPPANLSEILVIERGYKLKMDIPDTYDYGTVTDPVTSFYSYGGIV